MYVFYLYLGFAKTLKFEFQKVKILMKFPSKNNAFILLKDFFNQIGGRKMSRFELGVLYMLSLKSFPPAHQVAVNYETWTCVGRKVEQEKRNRFCFASQY